jgi:hypothetical protein
MRYTEPPRWQFYPGNARPTPALRQLIEAVEAEVDWLRNDWWPAPKTDTKLITRRLEGHLAPSGSAPIDAYGLRPGWNLETRENYSKIPYLYGEGDESLGAVQPDAVFVDAAERLTLVEIEGGGALTNYRGMKDIVETILLPFVDQLALVVPFVAHHTEPYRYYNRLTQALYAEQVVQQHLSGILIVGF